MEGPKAMVQAVPSWSGFCSIAQDNQVSRPSNNGYLPVIPSLPTELSTIHTMMQRVLAIHDPTQQFVCAFYGLSSTSSINEVRYQDFCVRTCSSSQLPQTQDALQKHVMRTNYRTRVWRMCPKFLALTNKADWAMTMQYQSTEWMAVQLHRSCWFRRNVVVMEDVSLPGTSVGSTSVGSLVCHAQIWESHSVLQWWKQCGNSLCSQRCRSRSGRYWRWRCQCVWTGDCELDLQVSQMLLALYTVGLPLFVQLAILYIIL